MDRFSIDPLKSSQPKMDVVRIHWWWQTRAWEPGEILATDLPAWLMAQATKYLSLSVQPMRVPSDLDLFRLAMQMRALGRGPEQKN